MSYRFVKISNYYPEYLDSFYRRHPAALEKSYVEMFRDLMADAFGWADFYSQHLKKLGVDAHEIVANDRHLTNAWAREHGSSLTGNELLMDQLIDLKPEVLFIQDPFRFGKEWVKEVKARVPSVRCVLAWCAVPFTQEHLESFKGFDAILTCALEFMSTFEKAGLRAYHLHHAFEASILDRLSNTHSEEPPSDFVFLGSLMLGRGMHNDRIRLLESLLKEDSISIRIHSHLDIKPFSKVLGQQVAYGLFQMAKSVGFDGALKAVPPFDKVARWPEFPRRQGFSKKLRASSRPPVYGIEMFKALQNSRVGFNSHIDCAGRYAANVRMFEVTGVGSCLVTDWKENMHELFDIDREVVTYRSTDECIEKVKWLISHPKECAEIAQAGQKRCLRDHNYENRVAELHRIILQELSKKSLNP